MTWTSSEVGVLVRAVNRAPSVHNTRPWMLEAHVDSIDLYERPEVSVPRHDPTGRDHVLSCGAALANLELAIRALGREPVVTLFPDQGGRPDLLARVRAGAPRTASTAEVERYAAIFHRRSRREPFSLRPVYRRDLRRIAASVRAPGAVAQVVDVRGNAAALADLFGYAGAVLRSDDAYQRELEAWSAGFRGLPENGSTLPWAGLVRRDTHLPDRITLGERIVREGLLVILTPDDTRRDHLLAGAALEQLWLATTADGLAGSVLTQPLHLPEFRSRLIEQLELAGFPQAMLRVGHPAASDTPAISPAEAGGEGR